ncbi:MAG: tyrosine-type recombinase/integrase [Gulosibacter sp.]|uniref:tyrosine-type recombinase/integrase n=1 Tax=Gulosibacter sp. TaxID=2817531 RepID=UPI003F93AFB0
METIMPTMMRGPLSGVVHDQLTTWLATEHYRPAMVAQILSVARGLSTWMVDHNLSLPAMTTTVFEAFANDYGPGTPGHALVQQRRSALRRFLVEAGYLNDCPPDRKRPRPPIDKPTPPVPQIAARELDHWGQWQHDIRGISADCIRHRRNWVTEFVASLCDTDEHIAWERCTVSMINAFIVTRAPRLAAASQSSLVDATRSLLRWAHTAERIDHDAAAGILRPQTSPATLPKGLTPVQVDMLLAACPETSVTGIRDRAVITVLSRLGLRAGETATLTLDDIHWATGRLTVVGKQQRRLTLPIPDDVGQALVNWLRVRPLNSTDRAVFVRLRPPTHALTSAGISDIVAHRADAAGLGAVHAHRLRHTAAMHIIAAGGRLREAQELLGHATVTTTRTYARSDINSLRTLTVSFGKLPQ